MGEAGGYNFRPDTEGTEINVRVRRCPATVTVASYNLRPDTKGTDKVNGSQDARLCGLSKHLREKGMGAMAQLRRT
jgi:hypothetical protein